MQIILSQEEIEQSINAYVRSQINIADDQTVTIDLKAGRGEIGFTATLDIRAAEPEAPSKPAKKATRSTPKAAEPTPTPKAEPEVETAPEVADGDETTGENIPETSEESPATETATETADTAEEAPAKPKKNSIFQFGNKAVGA